MDSGTVPVAAGMRVLAEIASCLSGAGDLHEIAGAVLAAATSVAGAEAGALSVADKATDELVLERVSGPRSAELTGLRVPMSAGVRGAVFASGAERVLRDVRESAEGGGPLLMRRETHSLVALPLLGASGEPLGVLEVADRRPAPAEPEAVMLLRMVAAVGALLLEPALGQRLVRAETVTASIADAHTDIKLMMARVLSSADALEGAIESHLAAAERWADRARADHPDVADEMVEEIEEVSGQAQHFVATARRRAQYVHHRCEHFAWCVRGSWPRPNLTDSDIAEIAREAADVLAPMAQARRVSLEVHERSAVVAQADGAQLFNAFYELLHNATRHTDPGGRVWVAVDRAGEGRYSVEVGDTGHGIADHVRHRIFGSTPLDPWSDSLRLGTKLVAGVVRAHFGTIQLDTEIGHGTVVRLFLPLSPREQE